MKKTNYVKPYITGCVFLDESLRKQEIWRQKQITTLYVKGRPIFIIKNNIK
jgi:hypothetical protein